MSKILLKEIKLSSHILSWLFIPFGFMFLIPGYPILCGSFFITLGIFQSFQGARESNDILYSALLPIAKKDIVRGKFVFVVLIELLGAFFMLISVLLRMIFFADFAVYRNNPLMNANLFALGAAFLIFGLFNYIFLGGFFKTGYKFGKPFVMYIVFAFILLIAFESMHHIPGLELINSFGFDNILLQLLTFVAELIIFALLSLVSCRNSCLRFERIDL